MTFGERMRLCRETRGISQKMLAIKSGVHINNISFYERDKFEPTLTNARKIAIALGVSIDYLAGLTYKKEINY